MGTQTGSAKRPIRLVAFLSQYCDGSSTHSYACLSLCEHMRGEGLDVELHVPAAAGAGRRPFVHGVVPGWLRSIYYRADKKGRAARLLAARQFERALRGADAAYVWASTPEPVFEGVKAAGVPLVVERVNCHRATAIPILDEAYRRAGLPAAHGISQDSLAEERRKLAMADYIFAPSPPVRKSLIDDGIPEDRILSVSYGWAPHRVEGTRPPRDASTPPVFLFVGTVCIRKGAHLLLEAWAEAGAAGRLDICGPIRPEIRAVAGRLLEAPGVRTPGTVRPFSRAAAAADVFVFPTLEEGSSLAVLEAMATGLAMLTTPMGAGEIIRHGQEGLVLDPYDRAAWADALRLLGSDAALRKRLGEAARRRAEEYTWQQAGATRRRLLLDALQRRQEVAR